MGISLVLIFVVLPGKQKLQANSRSTAEDTPVSPQLLDIKAQVRLVRLPVDGGHQGSIVHSKHAFQVAGHLSDTHETHVGGRALPPPLASRGFCGVSSTDLVGVSFRESNGLVRAEGVCHSDQAACEVANRPFQLESLL